MKKMLVVLPALMLIFAFAACTQQEAPAEEPQGEITAITAALEEGLPTVTLSADAVACEVTEEMAACGIVEYYENGDAECNCDVALYRFPDAAGMSAEEFANNIAEEVHGCIEAHTWDDTPCWQVVFFTEEGGESIVDMWIMDGAEYPVAYGFPFYVAETQIAGTPLSMWMPVDYTAAAVTEEQAAARMVSLYRSNIPHLPDLYVFSMPVDEWTYADDCAACEASGFESAISEEDFNALIADGVTLDDLSAYYAAQGCEFSANDDLEINGLSLKVMEYQEDRGGVEYNCLMLCYLLDGQFYEIYLSGPMDDWAPVGKAFLDAIHVN